MVRRFTIEETEKKSL